MSYDIERKLIYENAHPAIDDLIPAATTRVYLDEFGGIVVCDDGGGSIYLDKGAVAAIVQAAMTTASEAPMTDEKRLAEIEARKIVATGGQILLPFDVGDAQVTFASRHALANSITTALRAAHAAGLQEAAEIAQEHRQELFEDGLDCDLHDMTAKEAFLAGCDQERDCIAAAILAQKDKAPQTPAAPAEEE